MTHRARTDLDVLDGAALRAGMTDTGASLAQVGDALGIGKTTAEALANGRGPLRLRDVRLLPLGLRVRLLRRLLDEAEAEAQARPSPLPILTHVTRVTIGTGDLARAVDEALADGRVDDSERKAIVRAALRLEDAAQHVARDVGGAPPRQGPGVTRCDVDAGESADRRTA